MIFAPSTASVIEFSLKPNCNRCFGYMAMALGLDYWMVPQVNSSYYGYYSITPENVGFVTDLVRHLLSRSGHHSDL